MQQKSNIKDVIDGLIDSNGIKTEVTLTLTQKTLFRIVIALLISGCLLYTSPSPRDRG